MHIQSIADLAATARGRRLDLGLTQEALARRCGISRKWVYQFESGKPTAELAHVIRVLEELGLVIEVDIRHSAGSADDTLQPMDLVDLDALIEEHRR